MIPNKFSLEEKLGIQFRKALKKAQRRGEEPHYKFDDACDITDSLNEQERCIVRVDGRDGAVYHFTNQRILQDAPVREVIRYDRIAAAHWITKNPENRLRLKREEYDTFILQQYDGSEVTLRSLGDAWMPFLAFLSWYEDDDC